jgi:hypothetical protein
MKELLVQITDARYWQVEQHMKKCGFPDIQSAVRDLIWRSLKLAEAQDGQ